MIRGANRSARGVRAVSVGAVLCAVPILAACDGPGDDGASPSASAVPSASPTGADGGGDAGADVGTDAGTDASTDVAAMTDAELRRHLEAFDSLVEFEGLAMPPGVRSPVDTAQGFYGSETAVVEPAACTTFHEAAGLGTGADLTDAADDLVNPVGPFFVGGEVPEGDAGASATFASVLTRVFHDPAMAASLGETLLAGDCTRYDVRTTWDGGATDEDITIGGVDQVTLPGLDGPTVRISYDGVEDAFFDETGEQLGEGSRDPWTAYVHVSGASVISIEMLGVADEEEQAGRAISAFLEHMGAA